MTIRYQFVTILRHAFGHVRFVFDLKRIWRWLR